jgi:hypothetical protein
MRQYNLDGLSDQNRCNVLQQNFESERTRSDGARQEAHNLSVSLYLKQLQCMKECTDETTKLGRLVPPMVFSARKELELPINEAGYQRVTDEAAAKQAESIGNFIQELKALMAGPSPEGTPSSP